MCVETTRFPAGRQAREHRHSYIRLELKHGPSDHVDVSVKFEDDRVRSHDMAGLASNLLYVLAAIKVRPRRRRLRIRLRHSEGEDGLLTGLRTGTHPDSRLSRTIVGTARSRADPHLGDFSSVCANSGILHLTNGSLK